MRKVVVLPHPDGPSNETNSPARISRSMPSTALVPLYALTNPRADRLAPNQFPSLFIRHRRGGGSTSAHFPGREQNQDHRDEKRERQSNCGQCAGDTAINALGLGLIDG